jgi:hypothetical protein
MTKTQPVEFPRGTFSTTKERVNAILWATSRRGSRTWESQSGFVLSTLTDYLNKCGASYAPSELRTAMNWLVGQGHATKHGKMEARKTYKLVIHDNVDLSVPVPAWATGTTKRLRPSSEFRQYTPRNAKSPNIMDVDIPLPGEPAKVEPYRFEELTHLLVEWFDIAPEQYSSWVDQVIPRLEQETSLENEN